MTWEPGCLLRFWRMGRLAFLAQRSARRVQEEDSFLVFSEQNEAQSWHASIWLQQSSSEPVSSPPSKVPCERAAGLWRTGQKVTRPPLLPIHLQFCPPPHPSLSTQALPSPGLLGISLWSFRIRQPAHPGPQQPEQTHTGVLPFPLTPRAAQGLALRSSQVADILPKARLGGGQTVAVVHFEECGRRRAQPGQEVG